MITWALVILAVSHNNPNDVPGRVELEFQSQHQCEQVLQTMTYKLKFDSYKVTGRCEKK